MISTLQTSSEPPSAVQSCLGDRMALGTSHGEALLVDTRKREVSHGQHRAGVVHFHAFSWVPRSG